MIGNFNTDCCNTFNNMAQYVYEFVLFLTNLIDLVYIIIGQTRGKPHLNQSPLASFSSHLSYAHTHRPWTKTWGGNNRKQTNSKKKEKKKSLAILVTFWRWKWSYLWDSSTGTHTERDEEEVERMPLLCSALITDRDMQGGREQLAVYCTIWPLLGTVYTRQEGILASLQSQNPFHLYCSAVTFTYS